MSRCVFNRIQSEFDAEDRAALNQLITTSGPLSVSRVMSAAGYKMSEHTVRRHKRGDCMCQVTV